MKPDHIIEDRQQRRLNAYDEAFQKHLQATLEHRRAAFEERQKAFKYAVMSWVGAAISVIALIVMMAIR